MKGSKYTLLDKKGAYLDEDDDTPSTSKKYAQKS